MAYRFLPCGSPQSPTITVSPGGAVFTVCTGPPRPFTGDGDSVRAGDDVAYAIPPGREPVEYSAAPLGRPGIGGHRGRVL
jgi:hypothetical protein